MKRLKGETMKKLSIIIYVLMFLIAILPAVYSHEDEFGDSDNIHLFHMGKLTFPVWTYWAEIAEHFAAVLAVAIGLFLLYFNSAIKKISLIGYGLIFILISEVLTLFHHFLIFPLGIFNAVFNHGLLLIGFALLVLGLVKNKGGKNE